jgi:hypothetical protein
LPPENNKLCLSENPSDVAPVSFTENAAILDFALGNKVSQKQTLLQSEKTKILEVDGKTRRRNKTARR